MDKRIAMVILFIMAPLAHISAQRTAIGQSFITADALYTFSKGAAAGGNMEFGQYLLNSYWDVTVTVANRTAPTTSDFRMEYMHYMAGGDYMYRLAGTHTRSINLYGGGGLFLGYESYDQLHKMPEDTKTDLGAGAFLYGLRAQLLAEFFVGNRLALTARGRIPVNFSSPTGWLKYEAGIGVRYLF